MTKQYDRILSLLEYIKETAALKRKGISDLRKHQQFWASESLLSSLPGVHFNQGSVWIRLDRLQPSPPPPIEEIETVPDENEKKLRLQIEIYSKLFKIKHDLDERITDIPLELILGMGMMTWSHRKGHLLYPLLTQEVELHLDPQTMALEISPKDGPVSLELHPFSEFEIPGLLEFEKKAKEFLADLEEPSPFSPEAFHPLLKLASTYIDSKGHFIEGKKKPLLPLTEVFTVSDEWTLFARPKSHDLFVQDIERLKEKFLNEEKDLSSLAIVDLVTEPNEITMGEIEVEKELYFPLPYNDEQIKIIDLLKTHKGVVVQGPPGTGKTHTIANVICHYLALGKRVLVTSMKEPALQVIRDKVPEAIRPLILTLFGSDHESSKLLESSATQIASMIQSQSTDSFEKEIARLQNDLDSLRFQIMKVEVELKRFANLHFGAPYELAKAWEGSKDLEKIPDSLNLSTVPLFTNEDVKKIVPSIDVGNWKEPLLKLGEEIKKEANERTPFVLRPVTIDPDPELIGVLEKYAAGKRIFFLSKTLKKKSEESRVNGVKPASPEDFFHLLSYVTHFNRSQNLLKRWEALANEIRDLPRSLTLVDAKEWIENFEATEKLCDLVRASGAPLWADAIKAKGLETADWLSIWSKKQTAGYLHSIQGFEPQKELKKRFHELSLASSKVLTQLISMRAWYHLSKNADNQVKIALQAFLAALLKIGKGTGKRAHRYRKDARVASNAIMQAIPCWIMPHFRVSETCPPEWGCFDLVIVDEASQSDFFAFSSLARGKKFLIVGDDKQVSPEAVGMEEDKLRILMSRFLHSQVSFFRPLISPERSIYDLLKVVFASSTLMLREHFRCDPAIIEYSKREFYEHKLIPLRIVKQERSPLIDVFIEEGIRTGDVNLPEAKFIVSKIKELIGTTDQTIGVVSLLGELQAKEIWDLLVDEIGSEAIKRHQIACGDARTFQGKERDIIFLSLVVDRRQNMAITRDTFSQRFNVALSRAKNQVYLVRSVKREDLSSADFLRLSLLDHFVSPYKNEEIRVKNLRSLCESPFELEIYDKLVQLGYLVTPQYAIGKFRIDLVVLGENNTRLAIECDGDQFHGPEKWDEDLRRQRILERAGWTFWRCFASEYYWDKEGIFNDLLKTLEEQEIFPHANLKQSPLVEKISFR